MNDMKILLLSMAATAVMLSTVLAAGDAAKGKVLFNNPKFAHGVRACSECHPAGKGLENASYETIFHIAGRTQHSLEEAVNTCIVTATGGVAIDPTSEEMRNIVAYIKSLKGKKPADGY